MEYKFLILLCFAVALWFLIPRSRPSIAYVLFYPLIFLICRGLDWVFEIIEWVENITGLGRRKIEKCRKAAISGDAKAQFKLGRFYADGKFGLPKDYAEAVKWHRKAAEQNYAPAQLHLGDYLAEGQGVEQNVVEGYMWVCLSNQGGLGMMFRDGVDQTLSRLKAQMTQQQIDEGRAMANKRRIDGYTKAAISGDARAQCTLGGCHAEGMFGLPQDYAEAAKWFRKAAEQNDAYAQLTLGNYLAEGQGVEQNLVEAYMWIILAKGVRDEEDEALIRLKALMTAQQVAEALAMADKRRISSGS